MSIEMDSLANIVSAFSTLPDYIAKGIVELFVAIIGGLFVGWVGSTLFARKSQIAATEGDLLKKRLSVYEEFSAILERLRSAETLSVERIAVIKKLLDSVGFCDVDLTRRYVLSIFADSKRFTDKYLELDKYIATHRIFFDDNIVLPVFVFQNYIGALRRIQTLYEEQIINVGISLDNEKSHAIESTMMVEIGVLIEEEFSKLIDNVLEAMRNSIANLKMSYHKPIPHTAQFFSENGPIIKALKDTIIMRDREKVMMLVTENVSLAMIQLKKTPKH